MTVQTMSTDQLLTPAEVAAILFVDPKTVTRWARAGKLDAIRTPGGHRRYLKADVLAIMTGAHYSQKADVPRTAPDSPPLVQAGPAGEELDPSASAAVTIALALATEAEAEAEAAAQAVVLTAAAVSAAAERAATAVVRAREARAFAAAAQASSAAQLITVGSPARVAGVAAQVPSQRSS